MEHVRDGTKKEEQVLDEAKKTLTEVLGHFRKHEKKVGVGLLEATRETEREINTVGECSVCKEGTLIIRRGRFGLFVACDKYPECKTTYSVPSNSLVKTTKEFCPECKFPVLLTIRKGKRPWKYCINKECPKKVEWRKQQEAKKLEAEKEETIIKKTIKKVAKKAKRKTTKKKVSKK